MIDCCPLVDIQRVTSVKILGVTVTNRLSVSQHVHDVIASARRPCMPSNFFGMSRIEQWCTTGRLQGGGACQAAACISRLVGFRYRGWQAADWSIPASRLNLYSADDPTVSQCAADADDTLFRAVLANDHHVRRHLLPDRTSHSYSLRPRRHDCSLTIKTDSRNFVTRQLFIDM